jgi:2,4-dienoyl-CoA reductase-like NADH-dependent reductase (Old Yellow Enzyme family)/NADPH-dependent 2,4-dienoyl-CoA reductase/sulfur reductase-like enzyme
MAKLGNLLQPGMIGNMPVRNRIVFPPMITEHSERDGTVTQKQIDYYSERANGGCGLIIVEASCVQSPVGRGFITQTNLDHDKYLPGLARLADGMKKYGAKTCIQLYHAGNAAHAHITGMQPVGPSAVDYPGGLFYQPSRAMTREEMTETRQKFVDAALRCQKAGFDSVILHSNHQYLLTNFLSPVWNQRTDEYGGDRINRARYPVEVLKAVLDAVTIPVLVRINALEYGGKEIMGSEKEYTLNDAIAFAKIYEENGAAAIELSTWGYGPYVHRGLFPLDWAERLPLIEAIKKSVTIPVIGFGRFTPELADSAIAQGKADYIGFGRSQIVDSYFAEKVTDGKLSSITPCICCYRCEPVSQLGLETTGLHCSVNARAGYEADFIYPVPKAKKSRKVLVIGGGPGGMEAARVAAIRGHKVSLYEKSKVLGGLLLAADKAPEKQNMSLLLPYLKEQIKKAGVKVSLGKDVNKQLVARSKPDVVIVAIGAEPIIPGIKGLETAKYVMAVDILNGKEKAGEKVLVIGAGMQGLEVAEVLAGKGKKITVCETLPDLGTGVNTHVRDISVKRLRDYGAQFYVSLASEEITGKGMMITDKDGKQHLIEYDTLIMAAGLKPNEKLYKEIKSIVPDTYLVGDAKQPRYIMDAISEGFKTAYSI